MLWFWPNSDPQYKDILEKEKPPYIPELDDPSYAKLISNRDLPYGYGETNCHCLVVCILFDLGQSMEEVMSYVNELCVEYISEWRGKTVLFFLFFFSFFTERRSIDEEILFNRKIMTLFFQERSKRVSYLTNFHN